MRRRHRLPRGQAAKVDVAQTAETAAETAVEPELPARPMAEAEVAAVPAETTEPEPAEESEAAPPAASDPDVDEFDGAETVDDTAPDDTAPDDTAPDDTAPDDTAPDDTAPDDTAPDDTAPDDTVPDDTVPDDTVPDDTVPDDTVPDDTAPDDTVPDDTVPDDTVPDDTVPDDTVPDDTAPDDTAPDDTAPDDTAPDDTAPDDTAPDETEDDRPAATDLIPHRPAGWVLKAVAVVAAVLFVAAGAFAGAAAQRYLLSRAEVHVKLEVAKTAADAITTLFTYTPDDLEQLPNRSSQYLSGDFAADYKRYIDSIVAANKQAQVSNQTQVLGAAVESLTAKDATALVYTNSVSTTPVKKGLPSLQYRSYRLDLKHDDRRWFVTRMVPVTTLDLTPQL